ncbi:MAG TPA: glycosyltransferase [Terracidiphilus sp.]|jgi:dolichol-phosphate mannosyltransferase
MSPEKLALVIPTLGEARCLSPLLDEVREMLCGLGIRFEIIVVDDDSGDGTEDLVAAIGAEDPRVRLLVRHGQRGLAGAILHGWQHTDATLLGVMDGDLQHPPRLLGPLLAAMTNGCDLAIASRYAGQPGMSGCHIVRRWFSALAIWLTQPLQRASSQAHGANRVSDPLSGYFIVRRRCIQSIAFQTAGFKLLLEILIRGRIGGAVEVPFTMGPRAAGRSKAGLKVACDYLQLLARLYRTRWRELRLPAGIPTD